jgi:AcrR family transcriptional regulator
MMQAKAAKVTSEKILQTASKMFAEKGYANVSIRDVCKETATTAPVIYYYFGNKKGLYDAVARSKISMSGFISKLTKVSQVRNPVAGIESFVETYLSSFPEHTFDPGLYLTDSASLDRDSARKISGELEKVHALAAGLVTKSIQAGEFRKTDANLAAECLLGMLNRVIFQHLHFARASDRDAYGKYVTDLFIRALKA